MAELLKMTGEAMRADSAAITRLAKVPGIRVLASQQIVAETEPDARAFPSADRFSSWIGACPGRDERAGENHSSRCAKGNVYLRRILCQAAQAAVRTKNSFFEWKFRHLLPKLGYAKAIWAIVRHLSVVIWKILHEGAGYIEYGATSTPKPLNAACSASNKNCERLATPTKSNPSKPARFCHDFQRSGHSVL